MSTTPVRAVARPQHRLRLRPARRAALAAAVAGGLVASGCSAEVHVGGEDQVTGAKIAEEIKGEYAKREQASGIALTSLTCEEAKAAAGARIVCSGRNSRDIDVEIGGEITGVKGTTVDYRWRITRAFAPGTLYATAARRLIEQRLGHPVLDVSCPTRIELRVRAVVSCRVQVTQTATATAQLLLTDVDGGFRLRVSTPADTGGGSGRSA